MPLELTGLAAFILLLFVGVYAAIIGLPGTFFILGNVFIYSLVTGFHKIGFRLLALLMLLAVVAEAIGFIMELASKIRFGPSLKGVLASLLGGFLGALCLTPVLLGLGTLMGIFLGAFVGLFVMELIKQGRLKPKLRASAYAMLASAAGIFVKGSCALAMTIVILSKIYS